MPHKQPADGEMAERLSDRRENFEVGYRKPPRWTQFKPGQSGNLKGRKKREDTIAGALRAELAATQKVRENGKEKILTKAEILAKQWVRQALEGKSTAIMQIAKLEPKLLLQAVQAEVSKSQQVIGGELTDTDLSMMRWLVEGLNDDEHAASEETDGDDRIGENPDD